MTRHSCRAVVVGTGAGGATAAAVLARAGMDTLILEQGRAHGPEDHGSIIDSLARLYINGGATAALGRPTIPIPLGKAVGGTTLINSATCFRPPQDKVALWGGLPWEELEPWLDAVEKRINAKPSEERLLGGNYRVLKRGCDARGIPIRPLTHNLDNCQGSGRCAFGCPTGAKLSADRTFIPDAMNAGARLMAGHRVTGILWRNGRLKGLTGESDSGSFEVHAEIVVLAMGALATPAFLLCHGMGNRSGRVGRGLRIHTACRVAALFDEIVDGHIGLPQGAFIDHWAKRGIMMEGVSLPPGLMLAAAPGTGPAFKELAGNWRSIATFGIMISDTVTGRVFRGVGGFPFTACYQVGWEDAENLRFALARLGELYFEAGAKRVFTNVVPMPVIHSMDELRRFERTPLKPSYLELMAFHPTGTCAMGTSPENSVVNFDLCSHDVPNLYIMDGSVIPNALGVNPQVTIMALAWRAAYRLAAQNQHAA